jgi:hypothetical protein
MNVVLVSGPKHFGHSTQITAVQEEWAHFGTSNTTQNILLSDKVSLKIFLTVLPDSHICAAHGWSAM